MGVGSAAGAGVAAGAEAAAEGEGAAEAGAGAAPVSEGAPLCAGAPLGDDVAADSADPAPSGEGVFASGDAGLHAASAQETAAIHDKARGFALAMRRWYAGRAMAAMVSEAAAGRPRPGDALRTGLVEGPESWSHRGMRSEGSLRPLPSLAALAALALALAGCPRSKASGDDAPPPPPVTTPAAPAAPTLALGEHAVNVQADDSPGLLLYRVTVDETSTKLDFTFTNSGKRSTSVTVAPPGDKYAMFLEWAPGKKARFKSATGIGIKPKENTIPAGQSLSFSLVFEPLEPGVRAFDMYEGEDAKKVMPGQATYWVIRKIELK